MVPNQRYKDSRHILQNPTGPNYVMSFSNRPQRFTGSNYLDVDSPFKKAFRKLSESKAKDEKK